MKTVLLTGATGFLGSHLAKALVAQDYRIIALKRLQSNTRRIATVLSDIVTYNLEGLDLTLPFTEQGKIDVVIHTATCYGRNNESISEIFEANIAFPLRLLETAVRFNVDTFVSTDTFLSTGAILCKCLNAYALSKHHFKEWGKQFADMDKIRFVNIRLEHMYGPDDDDSKFVTQVIKACQTNSPELVLTLGEQKRDFIYIDDVVSAYLLLLKKTVQFKETWLQYELGSGHAVTIREFVETVHRLSRSRTDLKFGALPYRDNEIMCSQADIGPLTALGWSCRTLLIEGISLCMQQPG